MSANTPPSPYFSGINFNPSFFIGAISAYLTEAIANTKYLLLSGANFMTGNLGIGRAPAVELDIDGKAYINNNVSGLPTVGAYGGNSTRLILFPGTSTEYPLSLGVSNTVLWYGTQTAGSHIFYTGATEKFKINSSGATLSNSTLKVVAGLLDLSDASANSAMYLSPSGGSLIGVANALNQYSSSVAIGDTVLRGQAGKKLHFLSGSAAAAMTILENGSIGIGNAAPGNILQVGDGGRLRISNGISDFTQIGTEDGVYTTTNAKIFMSGNTYSGAGNNGGIQYFATGSGSHYFYTTNSATPRMRIDTNGSLCVGTTTATSANTKLTISGTSSGYGEPLVNITQSGVWNGNYALQVNGFTNLNGFRINGADGGNSIYQTVANADMGFSLNPANTTGGNILFFAQGAGGNIKFHTFGTVERFKINAVGTNEYISTTTTGFHRFLTNGTFENLRIIQDDFQIKTSCSTYGFNYYTDGEFIPNETRTNASGTARNGYFISCEFFYNSLVNIAASHNDITYNYWAGQVYCNNFTQPITITSMSNANCLFESFAEQLTGKYFLFFRPTGTFNASTQLRVKFYG